LYKPAEDKKESSASVGDKKLKKSW
jgi:hypothetical protein